MRGSDAGGPTTLRRQESRQRESDEGTVRAYGCNAC